MNLKKDIPFDEWVSNNNTQSLNYSKGWWDFIEVIREFSEKFSADVFVSGVYSFETPPPCEIIEFPLIKFKTKTYECYIQEYFSFSFFEDSIIISVSFVDSSYYYNFDKYLNPISKHSQLYKIKEGIINFEDHTPANFKQFTGTVADFWELFSFLKHLEIINNSTF